MTKPEFPIKVFFQEDGESWTMDNEKELATNLEWFDSEDTEEKSIVTDKQGRPVKLKVEALEVLIFELK